jgi:SsrA-binding protein
MLAYIGMSYIRNKKATFNYEIQESLEAGIELFGFEAKSIRASKGNLEGSYIIVRGGEAFLIGALISPFQVANTPDSYDERRNRKLIMHKAEIKKISEIGRGSGETVIPISFYNKGRTIKLEIAIVKGKKKHDKRRTLSKRESDREISREMKGKR